MSPSLLSPSQSRNFSQWRADASAAFGTLQIDTPDPASFQAQVSMLRTGDVTLYDLQTPAHTVERRPAAAAQATESFGKLSLQLEGVCTVSQDGRECVLYPGDLAFYVSQRPYRLHFPEPQHTLVVHFPEHFVHLIPEDIAQVTATRISGDSGLGRVAVPLFEQLAMNFEVLNGPHAGSLVRSALDMLVTVLSAELHHNAPPPSGELFRQATDYIAANLHDVELRPGTVAEALFVSLRHLHTQFAENGFTVANFIRNLRLEGIRRELADPRHARDTIQMIGQRYGLPEASQVSRAFRAAYGESPSAYRVRVLAGSV